MKFYHCVRHIVRRRASLYHHQHPCPGPVGIGIRWASSKSSSTSGKTNKPSKHKDIDAELQKLRNIGILAHVDAGKTTTTERMLYYSGATGTIGEVHDGDTITDFMSQERERGITIQSAAVSYAWKNHHVNLIDTPGHVDFTMEVERSIRVLDGVIIVLDGVAGVQAQSETVWHQATGYNVPKLVFVNKMDRPGASLDNAISSIQRKLNTTPIPIHFPVGEWEEFKAVVDLVTLDHISFGNKGEEVLRTKLTKSNATDLEVDFDEVIKARELMLESLSEFDDEIAEALLTAMEEGDASSSTGFLEVDGLQPQEVLKALRRITHSPEKSAVVVLCGSAYKNMCVQLLMDSVIDFLPSPVEIPPFMAIDVKKNENVMVTPSSNAPLCAFVFKIANHKTRGPLALFRVYSGMMSGKQPLLNTTQQNDERPNRLLQLFADDSREVDFVPAGHIGAAVGLKKVKTGDTLCIKGDPHPLRLPGLTIPQPVFTTSLETETISKQKELEEALDVLLREDPSLSVRQDEETEGGQTLLSGMGELHLDVSVERLRRDFNVEVSMGKMMVAYREKPMTESSETSIFDKTFEGKSSFAKMGVSIRPIHDQQGCRFVEDSSKNSNGQLQVLYAGSKAEATNDPPTGKLTSLSNELAEAVRNTVNTAFYKGPILGTQLMSCEATLLPNECILTSDSTPSAVRAATAHALTKALRQAKVALMEPVMNLEIQVSDEYVGSVLNDLSSSKRGQVNEVIASSRSGKTVIYAHAPLRELVGYATSLRSMTSGDGVFTMEFEAYQEVTPDVQQQILEESF